MRRRYQLNGLFLILALAYCVIAFSATQLFTTPVYSQQTSPSSLPNEITSEKNILQNQIINKSSTPPIPEKVTHLFNQFRKSVETENIIKLQECFWNPTPYLKSYEDSFEKYNLKYVRWNIHSTHLPVTTNNNRLHISIRVTLRVVDNRKNSKQADGQLEFIVEKREDQWRILVIPKQKPKQSFQSKTRANDSVDKRK